MRRQHVKNDAFGAYVWLMMKLFANVVFDDFYNSHFTCNIFAIIMLGILGECYPMRLVCLHIYCATFLVFFFVPKILLLGSVRGFLL